MSAVEKVSAKSDSAAAQRLVLVVDDDPDFLEQHSALLKSAGYRVQQADGLAAAEALIQEMRPDVAVVDLMMEESDAGFALCFHIKNRYPDVPVILVTAVNDETGLGFDAAGGQGGWIKADAFLAKPIRFEQLTRELDRLLPDA